MIVFYRGLHCPICKPYLRNLDSKEFESRGVDVIAAVDFVSKNGYPTRDEA